MLVVFMPIFVVDKKIIFGYNFIALLIRMMLLKRLDLLLKHCNSATIFEAVENFPEKRSINI